jgi:hypothetical protein
MFTLGSSALKYLADNTTDQTLKSALQDKYVGFVGTLADRTGDASFAPTQWSPFAIFFQVPADAVDTHKIVFPILSLTVYVPNSATPYPTGWTYSVTITADTWIQQHLIPAGGFRNVLYQIQRGNEADMAAAYHVDGVPFYARDSGSLWIWNDRDNGFEQISQKGIIPVGGLVGWPNALIKAGKIPASYIPADGEYASQSTYAALFDVYGDEFKIPGDLTPPNAFRLPFFDNMIIRYRD